MHDYFITDVHYSYKLLFVLRYSKKVKILKLQLVLIVAGAVTKQMGGRILMMVLIETGGPG